MEIGGNGVTSIPVTFPVGEDCNSDLGSVMTLRHPTGGFPAQENLLMVYRATLTPVQVNIVCFFSPSRQHFLLFVRFVCRQIFWKLPLYGLSIKLKSLHIVRTGISTEYPKIYFGISMIDWFII
jgi:hypothetical protein